MTMLVRINFDVVKLELSQYPWKAILPPQIASPEIGNILFKKLLSLLHSASHLATRQTEFIKIQLIKLTVSPRAGRYESFEITQWRGSRATYEILAAQNFTTASSKLPPRYLPCRLYRN